jgi:16S rRNA (cytosine967-C5)-methyltransferase
VAAARALVGVEDGGHVEDLLARLAPPAGPDRGLAWHLALGVLRRRGAVDALLRPHLRQPIESLDAPVRAALRLGAFEKAFSRTPPHAAVSQAVEVCRATKAKRASGLVNAVLRRVDARNVPADPASDLPDWLAERWSGATAWLARLQEPAPICGVYRDGPVDGLETRPIVAGGLAVPGGFALAPVKGPVDALPGFAAGAWWVMDPAAAAVADLALAQARGPGARVLDACAAPGGKSLRMASRGARVTAVDQSAERLARVGEGSARTGLPVVTHQHDWLDGPHPELGTFDVVLVDAPCTGLGTVRRHPEIKWRRLPSDPAAMALRQLPILEAAATHVAPGGALVYAVCSPMEEEGLPVAAGLTGWRVRDRLATFPPAGDEDAFQAFVLERA